MEWLEKGAGTLCIILSHEGRTLVCCQSALSVGDQQPGLGDSWLPGCHMGHLQAAASALPRFPLPLAHEVSSFTL